MSPVSVGTKKSGWCLTKYHETCIWKGCSCDCGHGAKGKEDSEVE